VLQLAAGGNSNQEIGQRLFISVETVKTHMRSVLQKLQARDRTHAAVEGLRLGLLDWPESG
jgi:DNA-binding NarL/FixJ family response regulator